MRKISFLKTLVIVLIYLIVNASPNTIFASTNPSTTTIGASETNVFTSQNKESNSANTAEKQNIIPTFLMTEITTPDFSANVGNSDYQTVNISGLNLSGDIAMTVSGADASQFTLPQSTGIQIDSTGANATVTLIFTPTKTGAHTATLTCSSAGATEITLPLTGVSGLDNPIALAATDISESGFKANWNTVPGATDYQVDVYFIPDNPFVQITEDFNSGTTAPTNWTLTGISGTYTNYGNYGSAAPALRFDATGDAITTAILPNAAKDMKFWLKGFSATGSSLLIEGHNGTSWIEIDNIISLPSTAKTYSYNSTTTPALPANITQFRYTYTKVTNNIALDDVSVTYTGPATTPVTGSPFTVTGVTNREFTGLTGTTNYYYRVAAKNANVTTAASNEIQVSALVTNTTNTYKPLDITASNGTIRLTANTGETVEVYNSTGQKILHHPAIKGLNAIPLSVRGLLIVKAGSRTAKILM